VDNEIEILLVGAGPKAVDAIEAELNRAHVGFHASRAGSEQEFMESCRVARPDLVLAVDSEATFDAVATLAAAREACPGTPLIVVAPPSGEYIAIETLHAGAVDYILADHLSRLGPAVDRAMKEAEYARAGAAADRATREAEERFRAVFENAPVGIVVHVGDRLLFANHAYLAQAGAEGPGDVPDAELRQALAVARVDAASFETDGVRVDGSRYPAQVSIASMVLPDGLAEVAFIEDISSRKRQEAELECYRVDLERMVRERTDELMEANRGLQEATESRIRFLASMSHELRTPLNSIIGFSGVLLQEMAGPVNEEQEHQLRMVYGAGRRLMGTIDDVLDISSIEAGRAEVSNEPADAVAVVCAVCERFAPLAEVRGLVFSVQVPDGPLPLVTDRERMSKIVRALLDNALKFTESGSVTVTLDAPDPEHIRLVVADTGVGITPEQLPLVFEEFRQIRRPDGARPSGAGLGLSICRKMANLLCGEITAASSPEGSQFRVLLPVEPPEEVA
jgi:signal transduction histidine kinase/DNA-binding NarL/FixJ family response regulator